MNNTRRRHRTRRSHLKSRVKILAHRRTKHRKSQAKRSSYRRVRRQRGG